MELKLHGHWRLSEPTRCVEDHAKLKLVRRLATALIGGDVTSVPIVHPLRWPGSVHRKGQPKLARIVELNENAEIDLGDAIEALEDAVAARGIDTTGTAHGDGDGEQRDTASLIVEILSARSYTAPLVALSARYAGGGMTRPKIVETLQGLMLAVPVETRDGGQRGRWQSRFDGIERMAASAVEKFGGLAQSAALIAEIAAECPTPIAELNERHFVAGVGGTVRVARVVHDDVLGRERLVFMRPADMAP